MKVRNRNFRKPEAAQHFWPSFTDVMSTIVLVLFFLVFLAYFQQTFAVSVWTERLNRTKADLSAAEETLELKKKEITDKENALRLLQDEAERLRAEVEQGKRELTLSLEKLQEQERIIAQSNKELGELRGKLQSISVLRLNILEEVKKSIEDEIGTSTTPDGEPLVSIDNNANLIINNRLLFAKNSAEISTEGQALLSRFAVAFERILDDENIRDYIDAINIQGHADIDGSYQRNYELSCQRAYAVINTMFAKNPSLEKKYGAYFAATGFSEFRPIDPGTTEAAKSKNRRIQISITIKDTQVQKIIQEYLEESKIGN
ncbi:OmpA/MotB domain protein [Thermoclostridium stercorarium subsp. stercorarium DSM 8532]|jgi:chemotaxis protein MotB|uniref:OmpA/MotB domain protein n=3 Tax=Thermoclostridium stercorarium TaxID=1510 RepID=L7VTG7_THES1|nr:OmpA family protein [Thermoclostridium stercorarium]AGC69631.1 OmpA/MotB domain protein [Thermoclostridium stercorarium subsp. stercorarium DSM 8532]AGI40583.1 outer membrane protein [Thermoclostridium stercorarium subsp. stercorarium DSM 8532]ANW99856.1 flagellar motor protein MotB [Thermoclostridium stercorarium subsp. thermolacticum DSM 2910]ANX02480.1 flagellar motor protein MotB [Thermoclostridium stercorarium subsp. leptospartum DSM 9219]UZQ85567.1 OmpA family protein [Thermoclostridi